MLFGGSDKGESGGASQGPRGRTGDSVSRWPTSSGGRPCGRSPAQPRPWPQCAIGRLARLARSEEHKSDLKSLMRISYAVLCVKQNNIDSTPTKLRTIFSYTQ